MVIIELRTPPASFLKLLSSGRIDTCFFPVSNRNHSGHQLKEVVLKRLKKLIISSLGQKGDKLNGSKQSKIIYCD